MRRLHGICQALLFQLPNAVFEERLALLDLLFESLINVHHP
jgi:hypothetical protein